MTNGKTKSPAPTLVKFVPGVAQPLKTPIRYDSRVDPSYKQPTWQDILKGQLAEDQYKRDKDDLDKKNLYKKASDLFNAYSPDDQYLLRNGYIGVDGTNVPISELPKPETMSLRTARDYVNTSSPADVYAGYTPGNASYGKSYSPGYTPEIKREPVIDNYESGKADPLALISELKRLNPFKRWEEDYMIGLGKKPLYAWTQNERNSYRNMMNEYYKLKYPAGQK
jgi:hypothetical protein